MRPSSKSLYHPVNNPPYQINYRSKRSGKHVSVTKRRVTFLFGFSNADAIASGLTEGECRGEEHEVVLIWSHVSGKRQVYMDGREIHTSKAAMGNTKFSHAWGVGSHVLKIVANASPSNDGSRQFDLLLDGMSYFEFKQIYQLGGGIAKNAVVVRAPSIETVPCSQTSSYQDGRGREIDVVPSSRPPVSELSIDVFEAPSEEYNLLESELPSPSYSTSCQDNVPSMAATYTSSYDQFSPVSCASYGTSQKSFAAISNEILTAYSSEDGAPAALMPPPIYDGSQQVQNSNVQHGAPQMDYAPQDSTNGNYVQPTQVNYAPQDPANNLAIVPVNVQPSASQKPVVSMYDNVQEQDSVDDLTACMNKLVNFDDVSKPSSSSAAKQQPDKSQSLQSLQWAMNNSGRAPTLSEIHSMKSTSGPTTLVMNNPQFYNQHQPQQYTNYSY